MLKYQISIGFCLLLLFSFLATDTLQAQSELPVRGRSWGMGARALSMGGAFSSVADDYSATYWNPAGLALVRRMEFLTSFPHLKYENKASYKSYLTERNENFTKMGALGFVFPIPTYRGSLVFAFGYNRTQLYDAGFGFSWFNPTGTLQNPEDDNDLMTETWDELERGHLGQYVASGAMDVSPNLSLGASVNWQRGKNEIQNYYIAKDDSNLWDIEGKEGNNVVFWDLDSYGWDDVITSELSGMNFKFGALYRLGQIMRFSGTVEMPYSFKIKENSSSHFKQTYNDREADEEDDTFSYEYKIKTPLKIGGGASVYLPQIVLAGGVEYVDWTQMEYQTDPPFTQINGGDSTKNQINRDIRNKYRPVTRIHLGGEFTVPLLNIQLRAGTFLEPSPFKNASKDRDRKYITLGAGLLLDKQMKLDVAWVHGTWKNESPAFTKDIRPLVEDITLNQFEVSLAIRF
jgi:long-subunit fatty acid transport protein